MNLFKIEDHSFNLLLEKKIDHIILVDHRVKNDSIIGINNQKFKVFSVNNFTVISAPTTNFEKIGLKKDNGLYFNYFNEYDKSNGIKSNKFVFKSALISFISLLDSQKIKYDTKTNLQYLHLKPTF